MTSIAEPIIILSDIHLNASTDWKSYLEKLRGLWRGAGTVIFNGDTMDWSISNDAKHRREVVDFIHDRCRPDGVEPVLIGGNTDHHLRGPRHLFLANGRVLVFHGDVIFPESSPWRSNARELHVARAAALRQMPHEERTSLEGQLGAALQALRVCDRQNDGPRHSDPGLSRKMASIINWLKKPWRITEVMQVWWKLPGTAASFMERYAPDAEVLVFGHAHRRGVWRKGGRTIINTGSFEWPAGPFVVKVDGSTLTVRRVALREGNYVPGKEIRRFFLSSR